MLIVVIDSFDQLILILLHTAREYYGLPGDAFALNDDGKPPNPLVDVGGMTSCALVHVRT